jgi:hypothetical protein
MLSLFSQGTVFRAITFTQGTKYDHGPFVGGHCSLEVHVLVVQAKAHHGVQGKGRKEEGSTATKLSMAPVSSGRKRKV